jgi:hypothetical protein
MQPPCHQIDADGKRMTYSMHHYINCILCMTSTRLLDPASLHSLDGKSRFSAGWRVVQDLRMDHRTFHQRLCGL